MRILLILTVVGVCTAFNGYRRRRDVSELSGEFRTSYDTDNFAYISPQSNNAISSYDYPKPLTEVLPPKPSLLYLPIESTPRPVLPTHPPRKIPIEPQPLPSENRPKYAGTGNYIFEIQADEALKSHTVDVESPFFKNTIHFV